MLMALNREGLRRRILCVAAMFATAFAVFAGNAQQASAHSLGGHFPYTRGTWLYLPYTAPSPYSFYPNMTQAASNWFNTPTRVYPYLTSNYSISRLDYYQGFYGTAWWGLTVHHPCSGSGCSYVWADLYLNSQTLNAESSFIRTKVATHEMGHGFGLAHPSWWDTSVMQQGYLSYNTPQSHDINDTNNLYPYW